MYALSDKKELLIEYMTTNQEKFYRLAYSYTKNKEAALDVIHDAIVKALKNIMLLRNKDYVKTWFYRILINECLNYVKYQKKMGINPEIEIESFGYEEKDRGICLDLYKAINNLETKNKEIIYLYFFEDMTFVEISSILKVPLSTIKSRFYKSLQLLKIGIGGSYEKY